MFLLSWLLQISTCFNETLFFAWYPFFKQGINHVYYETEYRTEWCHSNSTSVPCFLFARKFSQGAAMRLLSQEVVNQFEVSALLATPPWLSLYWLLTDPLTYILRVSNGSIVILRVNKSWWDYYTAHSTQTDFEDKWWLRIINGEGKVAADYELWWDHFIWLSERSYTLYHNFKMIITRTSKLLWYKKNNFSVTSWNFILDSWSSMADWK